MQWKQTISRPACFMKWTVLLAPVVAFVIILLAGLPADAQQAQLRNKLTADAIAKQLSNEDVRRILLESLAEEKNAKAKPAEEFNPAVIIYRFQRDLGVLSKELDGIFRSVKELPDVFPRAWAKFTADRKDGGVMWFFFAVAISMGLGWLAEMAVKGRLKSAVSGGEAATGYRGTRYKVKRLLSTVLQRFIALAIFLAIATAIYLVFFDDTQKDRIAFFFYLSAAGIFRAIAALSEAFHAPGRPELRLPLYSDADAASLHRTALLTVAFGAFAYFTCALFGTLGILGFVHELFLILVGTITTTLLVYTILSGRRAISSDIAGDAQPGTAIRIFSELWPWIFAAFVVVLWVSLVVIELLRDFVPYGAGLFTIGLFAVLPSLDALLRRDTTRLLDEGKTALGATARGARLALLFGVVIVLASAWRINPVGMAESGIGGQATGALFQITLTLLVAYIVWQTLQIFIDRKIMEEDAALAESGVDAGEMEIGGQGLSRMRTLLPLLKRTVQITLGIIVIMITLASLGIDIAPILAGAGVVGLAIGFGSQTLVRDIVSGAFFLIDDAFRLGEYIDVGDVKGTVEKMSIRSLRLRHHRGAVHTVPFGEIKTLTNYSRDWAIMKLKFRVPFDTDVKKVKRIFKQIGNDLLENEAIAEDFIQPLKSQGVLEVDDYGLIIRAKFMSKPGRQFMIRKEAFVAVQNAFKEHGIEFARPEVRVVVDDDDDDEDELTANQQAAAGAAAKIATAPKPVPQA